MMPGRTFTAGQETREGYPGHELDAETGMYYAGARYYMPALARWTAVDALAEVYAGWSPYNYVLNDPVALRDPDGNYVVDGTRARRFSIREAAIRVVAEKIPNIGVLSMASRGFVRNDPSFSPGAMDYSLAALGGLGNAKKALASLRGIDAQSSRLLGNIGAAPSSVASTGSWLSTAYSILGSETYTNLKIDEAIFSAATHLRTDDGERVGYLTNNDTVYRMFDHVVDQVGGRDEANTFLTERLGRISNLAHNLVKTQGLDLRSGADMRLLTRQLSREATNNDQE